MTTVCPAKRFTPELIRVYEARTLKKLVCDTIGEIQELENSPEVPACVKLLIRDLFSDLDAARMDTLNSIIDSISDCKTLWELLHRYLLGLRMEEGKVIDAGIQFERGAEA